MSTLLAKIVADFSTTITSGVAAGDTSATLQSATDSDGVALPSGRYFFTIDNGTASKEHISCSLSGTALTSIKTVSRQGTETSGFARSHRLGATVEITDFAHILQINNLLNGTTKLDSSTPLEYDGTVTPTLPNQLVTKSLLDATALGTTTVTTVILPGNAGETVSAGQLLYLLVSDGEWYKCDADTAATVDNIVLAIAQGSGTDGNAISGGVMLQGLDTHQTGLTNNTAYYASNTAGAISSTPGTTEVSVGISRSTTSLLFYPRYNQELTENQQDALAGNLGTPSATNLFVTQTGLQKQAEIYAATATGSDAYAITLTPTPTLFDGMTIRVKFDVANTGAATLDTNALGALAIVTGLSTPLVTGDILANYIGELVYNSTGTVWQLINPASIPSATIYTNGTTTKNAADASTTQNIAHGLGKTPRKIKITAITEQQATGNGEDLLMQSITVYNGTTQSSVSMYASGGTASEAVIDTTFTLNITNSGSTNTQTGVVTFDSTNIIITWTKTGSPTGTYTLLWEAEG